MTKVFAAVAVVLACLLGVQTYRVQVASRQLAEAGVTVQDPKGLVSAAPSSEGPAGESQNSADLSEDGDVVEADALDDAYLSEIDDLDRARESAESGSEGTALPEGEAGNTSATLASLDGGGSDAKSDEQKKKERAEAIKQAERMVRQARDLMKEGDYTGAIELLKQSIEADPSNREAYRNLASTYHTLGFTDEEMGIYANWMEQRPNDASPYYQQARLLESLGRDQEALGYLQKFQGLTQGEMSAYPMAASLYGKMGMRAEQRAALQGWVNEVPKSIEANRALARYYSSTGNKGNALSTYQYVADLAPANPQAHQDLGRTYQSMRMYDNAQSEYVAAMNLQPENMEIRLRLGDVYRSMQDYQAAVDTYSAVINEAPNTTEARQAQHAINRIERQLINGKNPNKPKNPKKPK